MEHPNWFEAITGHAETLNALVAIGGVFVGLALLFWVRKLAVVVVTVVTLLLGVLLVLVAAFGPIMGLIPEPAPVASGVYESTTQGIERAQQRAGEIQQGASAIVEGATHVREGAARLVEGVSQINQGVEHGQQPQAPQPRQQPTAPVAPNAEIEPHQPDQEQKVFDHLQTDSP